MPPLIDLNADLGEGVTDDAGLLEVVTSANVACGYHAGDEETMRRVCERAAGRGVAVGAQVSYDDRENFGRVARDVPFDVLREQVADQVATLARIAASAGTRVSYLKPHGALYNRVVHDEEQARAVLAGAGDLPVLGLPPSVFLRLAAEAGLTIFREGFPDRGYTDEGTLLPRGEPGALVDDPGLVAGRAVRMARDGVVASVCVHGDSPGAVETATLVRRALEHAGFELRPFVSGLGR
ncbi:MAG TPA: 5-oxoprolinase subunit PxpA [Nocardioidaceae bacterium]|nr:5-oxoprolinase subunit PxpA [Nocardioidaceae bacterium]